MRKNARAAKMLVLLGLISLLSACAANPGIEKVPTLTQKEVSGGLVPQEYLCPGGPLAEVPDPRLAQEICAFLEQSGMLGGIPMGMASALPMVLNEPVQG